MHFVPVQRQMNSIHSAPSCSFQTNFNIYLPSTLRFSKLSIPLNFFYHNSIFMYLILFELLIRIASEEYQSKSSSLCRFLQSAAPSFPLNPLNAELNPICHLLALLGAHHIFHVSGLRVKPKHLFQHADLLHWFWFFSA